MQDSPFIETAKQFYKNSQLLTIYLQLIQKRALLLTNLLIPILNPIIFSS